jgi:hypothetical protein
MATSSRARSSRKPTSPANNDAIGVVLIVLAIGVAVLLFIAGGGSGSATATDESGGATGSSTDKTTTTQPVTTTTPPASLAIVVANGSGTAGKAKKVAEKLGEFGYTQTVAVDGKSTQTTQIIYTDAAAKNDAVAIATSLQLTEDRAAALQGEAPLKDPTKLGAAKIIVLVGPDLDPTAITAPTTTAAG